MALPTRAGVRDAILRAVSGALSRTVLAIFGARSATALPTTGALLAMPVTRSPMRSAGRFDLLFAMSAGYVIRGRPCIPGRTRTSNRRGAAESLYAALLTTTGSSGIAVHGTPSTVVTSSAGTRTRPGPCSSTIAPSAFAAVRPHGHAVRPSASSVISPQAKHFSSVVMSLPSYPLAAPVEHRSTVSRTSRGRRRPGAPSGGLAPTPGPGGRNFGEVPCLAWRRRFRCSTGGVVPPVHSGQTRRVATGDHERCAGSVRPCRMGTRAEREGAPAPRRRGSTVAEASPDAGGGGATDFWAGGGPASPFGLIYAVWRLLAATRCTSSATTRRARAPATRPAISHARTATAGNSFPFPSPEIQAGVPPSGRDKPKHKAMPAAGWFLQAGSLFVRNRRTFSRYGVGCVCSQQRSPV